MKYPAIVILWKSVLCVENMETNVYFRQSYKSDYQQRNAEGEA